MKIDNILTNIKINFQKLNTTFNKFEIKHDFFNLELIGQINHIKKNICNYMINDYNFILEFYLYDDYYIYSSYIKNLKLKIEFKDNTIYLDFINFNHYQEGGFYNKIIFYENNFYLLNEDVYDYLNIDLINNTYEFEDFIGKSVENVLLLKNMDYIKE